MPHSRRELHDPARTRRRAALAAAPDTDTKIGATGLAAGIPIDATVIPALIVPAVVSLIGRWIWSLPRWPVRLLRVGHSLPDGALPTEAS